MLDPIYIAISWVMARWHSLWNVVLGEPAVGSWQSGLAWVLAIVFLVVTLRLILFPLFVKQVKSQRAMQEIAPELQKLRKQYGDDRQGYSQAVMALQKERGVNPLAGCLPILPQIPIFFGLFHVLRRLAPDAQGLYTWSDRLTDEAAKAQLFGAPISASFNMDGAKEQAILQIASYGNIRVVAFVLIVVMCLTTFFTQKQIMRRSGPVEGQAAMVQKLLLYGMPISLFFTGFFFPIGVLLYWFTNNLWTMGQQFFILRKMPPPGSAAAKAKAQEGKPVVDPRTLAPRPGAKPVRPGSRPQPPASGASAAPEGGAGETAARPGDGAGGGTANGRPAGTPAPARKDASSRPRAAAGRGSQAPANRGKRKRR